MKKFDITATFTVAAAEKESRTISGEIVRYGVTGNTSFGRTIFEPGSIELHADLSRIKLLEMHDQERSIGFMVDYADGADRMTGKWQVAEGDAGDAALTAAQNKTRDALSLGVEVLEYAFSDDDSLIVKAARLFEVSLVTIPAFAESRIESVAAARKEHDMSKQQGTPAQGEPQQENPAPEQVTAGAQPQQPAAPAQVTATVTPVAITPPASNSESVSLDVFARQITQGFQSGTFGVNQVLAKHNPNLLTAALTDVIPADDGGQSAASVNRPQWQGELWRARRIARPTIDSLETEKLTSMKGYGYKIQYPETPMINDYAGNKQPVPASGKITTVPDNWTAQRKAGGWDVDRIYFDFNDQEFVKVTLRAAYDDYLQQTEATMVAALVAAGVETVGADVLEILANIGASAADLGSAVSKIQFSADMWKQFTSLNSAEVPWWLKDHGSLNLGTTEGNAGGLYFNVNPNLDAGTVLGHDRRAATFRETPLINVQAENIPNGGIDLGVFGYISHTINDERAIFVGSTEAPVAG